MCFSATASFVAFGVSGAAGLAALSRTRQWRDMPLALVPLVFAFQQGTEGLLWLTLPVAPESPISSLLTFLFLVVAKVFWPAYAPLTVLILETDRNRYPLLAVCLLAGIGTAGYLLWSMISNPFDAFIQNGHIVYSGEPDLPLTIAMLYLVATGVAPMLSSHRIVAFFGAIILVGSVFTYMFYREALVSVWCFFAAAGSVVILAHFEQARRHQRSSIQT